MGSESKEEQNIILEIPEIPASIPPGPGGRAKPSLRSLAALITAIAAMCASIGSVIRKPAEPGAAASYKEMSVAVKENSKNIADNHDDLIALKNYIDGYAKAQEEAREINNAKPAPTIQLDGPVHRPPTTGVALSVKPTAVPAPTFKITERPPVWDPPDFQMLQDKKQ